MGISIRISCSTEASREVVFDTPEISIGRANENEIVLARGNISKRHTRLVVKDGRVIVIDQQSVNGTFLNGKKVSAPQVVRPIADKISIGDYTLEVLEVSFERRPRMPEPEAPAPDPEQQSWAAGIDQTTHPAAEAFDEEATPPSGTEREEAPEPENRPTVAPAPPPPAASALAEASPDALAQRIHRLALRLAEQAELRAGSNETELVHALFEDP